MMGSRPFWRSGAHMLAGALFVLLVCSASVAFAAPVAKGTLRATGGEERSAPLEGISAATAGIDEEIPGTELPLESRTTTFSGDLAAGIDQDDVHQVFLYAGEVVTVDLRADPATDYALYIYGPWAQSIWLDEPLASAPPYYYGGPDAYPLELTFKVPETGPYYLNACTWTDAPEDGGSGPYDLTVTIERAATGLMLLQQPTLSYAATATIVGVVYSPRFEDEVPAGDVLLSISLNGFNYMPLAGQSTDQGGFYFTWVWPMKAYYQVQFEGTAIDSPSAESITVNMRAALARPSASRYGTRSYTLSGMLAPQHTAGTYPVRIYLWKSVRGHWKAYVYRNARASNSGFDTRYSVKYKFPSTGKWRLQAYHSDSSHATTRSSYTYLTVR